LYTAFAALLIFGFLLWYRRRKPFPGAVAIALFVLYAVARFMIEFFRGDAIRGFIGPLSTSQLISALMAVAAALWFYAARRYAQVPRLDADVVLQLHGRFPGARARLAEEHYRRTLAEEGPYRAELVAQIFLVSGLVAIPAGRSWTTRFLEDVLFFVRLLPD